jgi:hypothetical protein
VLTQRLRGKARLIWIKLLCLFLLCLNSCTPGFLYTDITTPYCKDLRGTPLGSVKGKGSSKRVSIPFGRVDMAAEWDKRGIHDIANRYGMNKVYGCDQRLVSVFGGIWRKQEVIVYGE